MSSSESPQANESLADVAAAQQHAQESGIADREIKQAFENFAEENPEYYSRTFLKIQQDKPG